MADQNDQSQDPPAEDPTFVPLTRSAMAEKSLLGARKPGPKSDSEYSHSSEEEGGGGDMVGFFNQELRNQKIQELQRKAYYSVLNAFTTESTTISYKRTQITQKLMKELKITPETHSSFEKDLERCNLSPVCFLRSVSETEMQIVEENPLPKPQVEEETSVVTASGSGLGWGSVDRKSLVGKWVRLRLPGEDFYENFIIKEYDPKTDMHRFETTDSNAMEMDDYLSCMDLRQIPPDEIVWVDGERPDFGNDQWI